MSIKGGRPKWKPTPENLLEIERYAKVGVPAEIIAKIIGVAPNTLTKHCKELLDQYRSQVKADFMGALYKLGVKELVPSAVFFYLKTQCGFRETDRPQEVSPPTQLVFNRDADRFSQTSELAKEIEKTKKVG